MNKLNRILSIVTVLSLVLGLVGVNTAQAAAFQSVSQTLTAATAVASYDVSVATSHSFVIDMPATFGFDATGSNDVITVDFDETSAWAFSGTLASTEITLTDGTTTYTGISTVVSGTAPQTAVCTSQAANDEFGIAYETDTYKIHLKACATGFTFTGSVAGAPLTLVINGQSGGLVITNPSGAGSYVTSISMNDEGSADAFVGQTAVPIFTAGANDVLITATVDPSITLTLSSNTCVLGNITSTYVETCQYDAVVSTNAVSGYTAYISENHTLETADTLNNINYVGDAVVTQTNEEYGVSTSDTGTALTTAQGGSAVSSATCTASNGAATPIAAAALSTTPIAFASSSAPVSSDTTTLCHSVAVSGLTPAGAYSSTATITAVGLF